MYFRLFKLIIEFERNLNQQCIPVPNNKTDIVNTTDNQFFYRSRIEYTNRICFNYLHSIFATLKFTMSEYNSVYVIIPYI